MKAIKLGMASAGLMMALGTQARAGGDCVKASGPTRSESRPVGRFSRLEVKGSVDVHLAPGAAHGVRVEAPAEVLPLLVTEVVDGALIVRNTRCIRGDDVRVHVTAPGLDALRLSGSGDLRAEQPLKGRALKVQLEGSGDAVLGLDVDQLEVTVAGSGEAKLSGRATVQQIELSGSGEVEADKLTGERARVRVNGSGDVDVHVASELDAEVRGSGKVTYTGNPRVKRQVVGSGDIRPAR